MKSIEMLRSIGQLSLRLGASGLMMTHGWNKILSFTEKSSSFPDPLSVGPSVSLMLVIFAEFFCAFAVGAGLLTRIAALPVAFTMFMACFVVHAADPLQERELSLLYFTIFSSIVFIGPGPISLDHFVLKKRGRSVV